MYLCGTHVCLSPLPNDQLNTKGADMEKVLSTWTQTWKKHLCM